MCEKRNNKAFSAGVISPYRMQVEVLKQSSLHHNGHLLHKALDVKVKTVDGFEGNERDVIIFSRDTQRWW